MASASASETRPICSYHVTFDFFSKPVEGRHKRSLGPALCLPEPIGRFRTARVTVVLKSHHDERVAAEDAQQVRVPSHAEPLSDQCERHRVERPAQSDVAIGVDRALADGEARKRLNGEGLQGPLLDLGQVCPHSAAGQVKTWCVELSPIRWQPE